jgi:hypothetical protein
MPVQMESFSVAWDKLASRGLDLTRASFEIGWELAHLAYAEGKELSSAGTQGTATAAGQKTPGAAGQGAAADHYEEILQVRDLSSVEDRQARVESIGAALWYFNSDPQNEIAASINVSLPNIDDLRAAAAGGKADIRPVLAAFHVTMVKACATLDGTTAAAASNNTAPTLNGLREAYEVGRLLAVIVLRASDADTDDEFRNLVSVDLAEMSPAQETDKETIVVRAYSMLGGLKGCFPSAAAYSVARHLEDWSAWVNNRPLDYPTTEIFKRAEAQAAILAQGRVWRAILSGQTLARDYIVATSVTDAANRLFVSWAANATAIARSFLRTALARFFLVLGIIALLVFIGAFLVDLLTQGGATSGAKNGLTITAVLAALGSAAGIFHVSRRQVTSALADIWGMVEPPMVEAELVESIALSTRRLPADTVGGASPPQTKTMKDRLLRARHGSLLPKPKARRQGRGGG